MRILASALRPAKAHTTCVSSIAIFLTVLVSCNLSAVFFSTPNTTIDDPRTPTSPSQPTRTEFYEENLGIWGIWKYSGRASFYGFAGIFDLEDVPVCALEM
jgi:hypothetical protein